MVKIRIPASSANLGPGFDCLGLALKLYLYLEMEEIEEGLIIEGQGEGAEELDQGEDNLIWKSAELVFKKVGWDKSKRGLKMKVFNQIPVTRGLGSSAAAIIGGIVGAAGICKIELSLQEMLWLALSLEGHLDNIVPALVGGFTLAYKTEQEEIKWAKIMTPADLRIVLAIPDFSLSTEEMRRVLPSKTSLADAVFNLSRSALLVNALPNSNWEILAEAMEDKLHQPFRAPFIPGIEEMFSQIKRTGLAGVALSGSGPTIVSLTKRGSEELISKIMEKTFFKEGINCRIIVLEVDNKGVNLY